MKQNKNEVQWFREAFITEIGFDIEKKISFRELLDIIICSGKDITSSDLHNIWPNNTRKSIFNNNNNNFILNI